MFPGHCFPSLVCSLRNFGCWRAVLQQLPCSFVTSSTMASTLERLEKGNTNDSRGTPIASNGSNSYGINNEKDELGFWTRNGLTLESFKRRTAVDNAVQLDHTMKSRHLHMIAIGGSIGAGLFVGSGSALSRGVRGAVLLFRAPSRLVPLALTSCRTGSSNTAH